MLNTEVFELDRFDFTTSRSVLGKPADCCCRREHETDISSEAEHLLPFWIQKVHRKSHYYSIVTAISSGILAAFYLFRLLRLQAVGLLVTLKINLSKFISDFLAFCHVSSGLFVFLLQGSLD